MADNGKCCLYFDLDKPVQKEAYEILQLSQKRKTQFVLALIQDFCRKYNVTPETLTAEQVKYYIDIASSDELSVFFEGYRRYPVYNSPIASSVPVSNGISDIHEDKPIIQNNKIKDKENQYRIDDNYDIDDDADIEDADSVNALLNAGGFNI